MPYKMQHNKLNDLPLTTETYDKLCRVCTFGEIPIGGKVVVKRGLDGYNVRRYVVISNPIGLDAEHIAFWCDNGNLPFGFAARANQIDVYID